MATNHFLKFQTFRGEGARMKVTYSRSPERLITVRARLRPCEQRRCPRPPARQHTPRPAVRQAGPSPHPLSGWEGCSVNLVSDGRPALELPGRSCTGRGATAVQGHGSGRSAEAETTVSRWASWTPPGSSRQHLLSRQVLPVWHQRAKAAPTCLQALVRPYFQPFSLKLFFLRQRPLLTIKKSATGKKLHFKQSYFSTIND